MDRAVPAPQDHGRLAQRLGIDPATRAARIPDDAVVQAHPEFRHRRVAAQRLVGQEGPLAALAQGPGERALAFDEVQTVPPCRPVKALMSAEEFMYVTGTTSSARPKSSSVSQHSSTWL